jgi:hypothetical protein
MSKALDQLKGIEDEIISEFRSLNKAAKGCDPHEDRQGHGAMLASGSSLLAASHLIEALIIIAEQLDAQDKELDALRGAVAQIGVKLREGD